MPVDERTSTALAEYGEAIDRLHDAVATRAQAVARARESREELQLTLARGLESLASLGLPAPAGTLRREAEWPGALITAQTLLTFAARAVPLAQELRNQAAVEQSYPPAVSWGREALIMLEGAHERLAGGDVRAALSRLDACAEQWRRVGDAYENDLRRLRIANQAASNTLQTRTTAASSAWATLRGARSKQRDASALSSAGAGGCFCGGLLGLGLLGASMGERGALIGALIGAGLSGWFTYLSRGSEAGVRRASQDAHEAELALVGARDEQGRLARELEALLAQRPVHVAASPLMRAS